VRIAALRDGLTIQDLLLSNGSLGAVRDIDVYLIGEFASGYNLTHNYGNYRWEMSSLDAISFDMVQ
jgi:hypothetical protein